MNIEQQFEKVKKAGYVTFNSVGKDLDKLRAKEAKQDQYIKALFERIEWLDSRVSQLESKDTQSVGLIYTGSANTEEVVPAKYKRITIHLQELQAMYNSKETEWERNFIQSILDFTGQTVTEKQLKVLKDLSQKVDFEKELVTIR